MALALQSNPIHLNNLATLKVRRESQRPEHDLRQLLAHCILLDTLQNVPIPAPATNSDFSALFEVPSKQPGLERTTSVQTVELDDDWDS